jgi:hypothetical protein
MIICCLDKIYIRRIGYYVSNDADTFDHYEELE